MIHGSSSKTILRSLLGMCALCSLAFSLSGCGKKPEPKTAPVDQKPAAAQAAPAAQKASVPRMVPDAALAKKYVGKYLNGKYPDDFTELKSDGTFLYQEGKLKYTGKFAIQGNQLLLALPDGSGSISKIDDSGMTDSNGERWKRK